MKPLSERDENIDSCLEPRFSFLHWVGMKPLSERDENYETAPGWCCNHPDCRNEATL